MFSGDDDLFRFSLAMVKPQNEASAFPHWKDVLYNDDSKNIPEL